MFVSRMIRYAFSEVAENMTFRIALNVLWLKDVVAFSRPPDTHCTVSFPMLMLGLRSNSYHTISVLSSLKSS